MMKIIENMVGQTSASVMPVPFHRHKSPRSVPSPRINLRKTPFYDTSVEDNMIFTIPCCMYRCILCHKQTPLLFISGQISLDITKEFFCSQSFKTFGTTCPTHGSPVKKTDRFYENDPFLRLQPLLLKRFYRFDKAVKETGGIHDFKTFIHQFAIFDRRYHPVIFRFPDQILRFLTGFFRNRQSDQIFPPVFKNP